MEKKFLPIGTVVLLKGGTQEVMITGYCIYPKGKVIEKGKEVEVSEKEIFDYSGCVYPIGIVDQNVVCAFNHSDIEKVSYMGYKTDMQKEYSDILNAGMENYNKQNKVESDNNGLEKLD